MIFLKVLVEKLWLGSFGFFVWFVIVCFGIVWYFGEWEFDWLV